MIYPYQSLHKNYKR